MKSAFSFVVAAALMIAGASLMGCSSNPQSEPAGDHGTTAGGNGMYGTNPAANGTYRGENSNNTGPATRPAGAGY